MAETEANVIQGKTPKAARAETVSTVGVTNVNTADGFSAPIADPGEGKVPDHIAEDTLMAKGVDPDAGLVTVNLLALKKQHGEKKGAALYRKIAVAGGFFDPNMEPSGSAFSPDLSLEGLHKDARAKIDAILKEA